MFLKTITQMHSFLGATIGNFPLPQGLQRGLDAAKRNAKEN